MGKRTNDKNTHSVSYAGSHVLDRDGIRGGAPKVTYIDAPVFPDQIYLYGEPNKADVDAEQWYEIEGRGQFVRNVKVPTLIPYLPDASKSNGAAIIIAPGGAFLYHTFGSGGYEAAEWFKNHGFATFILKYRVEETPRSEEDYQVYVAEKMAGYRAGGKERKLRPRHARLRL